MLNRLRKLGAKAYQRGVLGWTAVIGMVVICLLSEWIKLEYSALIRYEGPGGVQVLVDEIPVFAQLRLIVAKSLRFVVGIGTIWAAVCCALRHPPGLVRLVFWLIALGTTVYMMFRLGWVW